MTHIISTNPSKNYEPIGSVEVTSDSDITLLVEQSRSAQKNWGYMSVADRVSLLRGVYDGFVTSKETLAHSVAGEMGMPIILARDEVQY
jgi:acyl-CoA reductase-like NAD-dependent aldehyde dehydrogenase